jgi:hypothetical protein
MATRNKVTESNQPARPRPSAAERRAAEVATLSTKQAELKNDAARRRQARELREDGPAPAPPRGAVEEPEQTRP